MGKLFAPPAIDNCPLSEQLNPGTELWPKSAFICTWGEEGGIKNIFPLMYLYSNPEKIQRDMKLLAGSGKTQLVMMNLDSLFTQEIDSLTVKACCWNPDFDLAELKEKFKDDPRKVQQETMKLYKEHKVNPFGGCLPMLLQMPVLFAMFHTLQKAVQLWGAPFTLWITDLSQPDSLIMFGQKFLIFDRLNILPIFMLVSFYLQQKIMSKSQSQDPQQKMMGTMMLVVFGYIFYNMPAGLNLYFTISTLLRTLQQYLVQKHN